MNPQTWTAAEWRRFHLIGLVAWAGPGAFANFVLGWADSTSWVAFMSLVALVLGHLAGYGAARAEGSGDTGS